MSFRRNCRPADEYVGHSVVRGWVAATLLVVLSFGSAIAANSLDRSDLNGDGIVDDLDLTLFSQKYLAQDAQQVQWCSFYSSSVQNPRYFRRVTSDSIDRYKGLLDYMATCNDCSVVLASGDKSDLNNDGMVDLDDLILFSTNYLEQNWLNVDWCVFHGATLAGADFDGKTTRYYQQHFAALLAFINDYFSCNAPEPPPNNLALENSPRFLARVADATAINGNYYVSDPQLGSVFIYDELMVLTGELKGLDKPLGVALDSQGRILVGNDGRDNIEVFDATNGNLLAVFGQGVVQMPTAIKLDDAGNIYVVDSMLDRIHVFDPTYNLVRAIGRSGVGQGTLDFPMDAEIIMSTAAQEIFIADQGTYSIQVFGLDGTWRRSFGFGGTPGQNCNWFTGQCAIPGVPPFTRVQALSKDSQARLHVLDTFAASVMIFDPADGAFISSYGAYGTSPGQLRVPMDVSVSATDLAIVTAGDGGRIEIFGVPQ